MKILFCGHSFPEAPDYLRPLLPDDQIEVWDGRDPSVLNGDVDVLIPKMQKVDDALLRASGARLVQQWGSGLEGVDLAAAADRGVAVANLSASGGNAESVAEHTLLLILALLRRLPEASHNVRHGVLGAPTGRRLGGLRVCLFGLGAIARPMVGMLRGFGVELIGISRDGSPEKAREFGLDHCYSLAERQQALARSDVLILCVRLNEQTRNLIGAEELAALPRGALLINVARGGVVDHAALLEALRSGHLGGAGLDVFWQEPCPVDEPLLALPNVIATPHLAGVTEDALRDIADGVAANIERLRRNEALLNRAV